MKRRTFIGSLLGVSSLAVYAKQKDKSELLDTRFTGCSSHPLDGEGGNYVRFFKHFNGFDLNQQQYKWLSRYYTSLISVEPVGSVFIGDRQTGMTTFAWTTMLYFAAFRGKKIGVMSTSRELRRFFDSIFENEETEKCLTQYTVRNYKGDPAFVKFNNGGSINFIHEIDYDTLCNIRVDQIWKNEDGLPLHCRGRIPAQFMDCSPYKFYYGTL